jgi:hypothetical protein
MSDRGPRHGSVGRPAEMRSWWFCRFGNVMECRKAACTTRYIRKQGSAQQAPLGQMSKRPPELESIRNTAVDHLRRAKGGLERRDFPLAVFYACHAIEEGMRYATARWGKPWTSVHMAGKECMIVERSSPKNSPDCRVRPEQPPMP